MPTAVNEAEGDFAWTGTLLLAGTGFRTDPAAHAEAQEVLGVPVVSLRLVDPRYYHLDTALFVLDDSPNSRGSRLLPRRLLAGSQRCCAACSPTPSSPPPPTPRASASTACPTAATSSCQPRPPAWRPAVRRGYEPVCVDISELRKSGGGPKCCTLELRKG